MKVLVIDVAGTHLKTLASGSHEERKIDSGPTMTPSQMVKAVKRFTADWSYDAIAMGYPPARLRATRHAHAIHTIPIKLNLIAPTIESLIHTLRRLLKAPILPESSTRHCSLDFTTPSNRRISRRFPCD